jgi:lipopolysaccharide/colanic/teichoic acid biosynthesis glycosyltransferase
MAKRIFDILFSLIFITIFSPLYIMTAILVWVDVGTPLLFRQQRPTLHEKIFGIYKFRTMSNQKDENGMLLGDEYRIGKIGNFIRSFSLDELPQLFNVLLGDMSIVGPRPLLVEYLPLYNEKQRQRHNVKAGITGWAQVNGRNAISWEQKFEYDVWYVEHQSFMLDMKILWLTVLKLFKRNDISSNTSVTMEKFRGAINE